MTMLHNSFSQTESSRFLRIILCGGGIAGFATAPLLREDHNVIVLGRCYERNKAPEIKSGKSRI